MGFVVPRDLVEGGKRPVVKRKVVIHVPMEDGSYSDKEIFAQFAVLSPEKIWKLADTAKKAGGDESIVLNPSSCCGRRSRGGRASNTSRTTRYPS